MWLNKIKKVFIGPSGLRGVWRVLMALVAYLLWTTLAAALLTLAFANLFNAWGVNTLNLHLAPAWARAIVNIYPYAISLLVNVPAALALARLTGLAIVPLYALSSFTVIIKCIVGGVFVHRGYWVNTLTGTEGDPGRP